MSEQKKNSYAAVEDDLEEMREKILEAMLLEVPFDGWTTTTLKQAALAAGMSAEEIARGDLKRAFPQNIADVLTFWAEIEDLRMVEAYEAADPAPTRIRDKVTFLVRKRIELLDQNREAARRASATLSLPLYAGVASRLTWRTSDVIWRTLGDTSTDYNYYTKRTILSAVYLSTLTKWFSESSELHGASESYSETWDFLDRRIENVMSFEKVKSQMQKNAPDLSGVVNFLGKLRYGASSR